MAHTKKIADLQQEASNEYPIRTKLVDLEMTLSMVMGIIENKALAKKIYKKYSEGL